MDMIRKWGYGLDLVPVGKQIFDMIRKKDYELVLLDMEFPIFMSCSIITNLKQIHSEMKIITVTSLSSPEVETMVRGLGIIYYLTKPFAPEELRTILAHISEQQRQVLK